MVDHELNHLVVDHVAAPHVAGVEHEVHGPKLQLLDLYVVSQLQDYTGQVFFWVQFPERFQGFQSVEQMFVFTLFLFVIILILILILILIELIV